LGDRKGIRPVKMMSVGMLMGNDVTGDMHVFYSSGKVVAATTFILP